MALRKILVATDHSETAQRAEEFVGKLASADAPLEVTLLYVHPEVPRRAGRAGTAEVYVPAAMLGEDEKREMELLLAQATERIRGTAGTSQVRISQAQV